jgi:hypothetical protein
MHSGAEPVVNHDENTAAHPSSAKEASDAVSELSAATIKNAPGNAQVNSDAGSFADSHASLKTNLFGISAVSKNTEKTAEKISSFGTKLKPKVITKANRPTRLPVPSPASGLVVPLPVRGEASLPAGPTQLTGCNALVQDSPNSEESNLLPVADGGADISTFAVPFVPSEIRPDAATSSALPWVGSLLVAKPPATTSFHAIAPSTINALPEDFSTEAAPTSAPAIGGDALRHADPSPKTISVNTSSVLPATVPEAPSHLTIVPAKGKAPQAAISNGRGRTASSTSDTSVAASALNASQHLSGLAGPENSVHAKSAVGQSTIMLSEPDSGEKTVHSGHLHPQPTSEHDNQSVAPERTTGPATSFDFDSRSITTTVTHASLMPLLPTIPAEAPLAVTPELAHSASNLFTPPAQSSVLTSTHPQPQIQPNPIPDPPHMVDSGQLRVNPNSSELKISVQLPELGKIEVRAVTAHDITTAHLTASRTDALHILATDRTGLEQALKSRDVILGSLNSHAQAQSGGQQRQQSPHSALQFPGGTSSIAATPSSPIESVALNSLPDHSSISVRA